ncbi:MAG: hypothetical protein A2075_12095 [Geobacteraceae bacterium GWC2_58_44]|nr:MAG: hypothetical protein A2075_12095 [Geobacteraceae bacterium GWC2_58_44]HBG06303.1 hypothetical protein [Geobacter sp.]
MSKDSERWIKEAKENLKDHQFKQLASWGEGGSEVWECSRPGSSCYAFTICITRMGIAVVGDIDGLTFNVGSNYGMPFLAGNDVGYYIHSKLEASCKEKELNRERYFEWVAKCVIRYMADKYLDELRERKVAIPDWLTEDADPCHKDFERLKDFVYRVWYGLEAGDDLWDWFYACHNTLDAADGTAEIHEAYSLHDLDGVDFDWCDAPDFEKPRESLMVRLHMVNEAAKRIMEGQAEAMAVGAAA